MVRIGILGNCCTGDILRLSPTDFQQVLYYAGTTLISLMAKPVPIREEDVHLDNRFEKRTVLYDFRKTFFRDVQNTAMDYLIINLLTERWGSKKQLKTGESLVTRSAALIKSGLEQNGNYHLKEFTMDRSEYQALWEKNCLAFINRLKAILPTKKVILHKAMVFEQYRDGEIVRSFPPETVDLLRQQNADLERVYEFFLHHWSDIHVLDMSQEGFIASSSHSWGLTPFHYEDGYYKKAANKIRQITGLPLQPE